MQVVQPPTLHSTGKLYSKQEQTMFPSKGSTPDGDADKEEPKSALVSTAAAPSDVANDQGQPAFVTSPTDNDILLGRGRFLIKYPGNVAFRELARPRKSEYAQASTRGAKDQIARELLQEVAKRNGRFLRKIVSPEEARALGAPEGGEAWKVIIESEAMEKAKQTLRDKEYIKPGEEDASAVASVSQQNFLSPLHSEPNIQAFGASINNGPLFTDHQAATDDRLLQQLLIQRDLELRFSQAQQQLGEQQQQRDGPVPSTATSASLNQLLETLRRQGHPAPAAAARLLHQDHQQQQQQQLRHASMLSSQVAGLSLEQRLALELVRRKEAETHRQQQQQQQQNAAFPNTAATTTTGRTSFDGAPPAPAISRDVGLFQPSPMKRRGKQSSSSSDETEDVTPRAQKKPKK